jgi:hypothetical protein
MAKYAIVKDNVVINIIDWDGVTEYTPSDGVLIIADADTYLGGPHENGAFVARGEEPDTSTYVEKRQVAYGSIGDQLDMQYHDGENGTTTWKDHVASVKAAHPKPE